jgi:hypothetical protein
VSKPINLFLNERITGFNNIQSPEISGTFEFAGKPFNANQPKFTSEFVPDGNEV